MCALYNCDPLLLIVLGCDPSSTFVCQSCDLQVSCSGEVVKVFACCLVVCLLQASNAQAADDALNKVSIARITGNLIKYAEDSARKVLC